MTDNRLVLIDLDRRMATIARRLAALVEERCSADVASSVAAFLNEWADATGPPGPEIAGTPLALLTAGLGLTGDEVFLLLLAGLPEEHEGMASTLSKLHPNGEPRPTLGLAALLLGSAAHRTELRRMLHEGTAVGSGLLATAGAGAFFDRSLIIADQVWQALHGVDAWPERLPRVAVVPPPAGLDSWLELPAVGRAAHALSTRRDCLLLVGTADETIGASRCSALTRHVGRLAVAARVAPDDGVGLALLALHAMVRDAVPVAVAGSGDGPAKEPDTSRVPAGPMMICAAPGAVLPPAGGPMLTVPIGPISIRARRDAWHVALPEVNGDLAPLASRHPLDPAVTALVARDVAVRDRSRPIGLAEVSAAIRARAGIALPAGIDLITPRAQWSDLILDEHASRLLHEAVQRLTYESVVLDDWGLRDFSRADRGVRLLLSGPPGTGKSLAAEVIADAAKTDLLVVDVARVVSKWLGDTEKNLAAVFDVAEQTQAVLFLDEADSLFATRTEVGDAHDRYANQSTSWLLQRIDHFDGLAVLATNLRRNIDAAFVRRMDFIVEFAPPDEDSRRRIWERHLPPDRLAADVDLAVLARRYEVPGAWIRNAAIGAAFRAAPEYRLIGQDDLVAALEGEYGKAVRPFPDEPAKDTRVRDERAAHLLQKAAREAEKKS
ncbi:ATP-binding protein [Virgisporangium ochraceum]|uniref:ATPase n=1 Tax=Virgisporangium ochraceum TaxID=65505 RepID=A0A8J4EHV4_9ACTN|nr:ATP-binding protein [Virgisporangium ochraceum]GIJ75101.1 ATPase [Virgisporangium ochraceum]